MVEKKPTVKPSEEPKKQKKHASEEQVNWRRPKKSDESRRARIIEVYEESEEEGEPTVPRQELPFREVAPVTFATPNQGLARDTQPPSHEKSYRLMAPINELKESSSRTITERLRQTPVTLTLEDLLAVAPTIQEDTRNLVTKKRVPVGSAGRVHFQDRVEEIPVSFKQSLPDFSNPSKEQYVQSNAINAKDMPFDKLTAQFFITQRADGLVPEGAVVANDPVLQYLASVPKGETPKQVFVNTIDRSQANDSAPLRVVYPLINDAGQVESILDGGSQIVSMALAIAESLGLTWDPDINIFMQSANAQVEKSVGLAKNVAFRFGDITIYLQVHIIQEPAYKVLLGRPFEILTASVAVNKRDGGQILTLTDPQTQKRCTLPTLERGTARNVQRDTSTENPEEPKPTSANFHGNSRT